MKICNPLCQTYSSTVVQKLIIKENTKAPRHWLLWGLEIKVQGQSQDMISRRLSPIFKL